MPLQIDLADRVVWVTGGAAGIGAAIVALGKEAGARVISLDTAHAAQSLDSAANDRVHLDLRDPAAIREVTTGLCERGLLPDVLVNNAGIRHDAISWKMTDHQWDEVIRVNLGGAFRMSQACAAVMRTRTGGAIVNVTSINGLRGKVGQANYAASKAGLIGLTKTLARELGRTNIRVNAVAPGMVETPMTQQLPADVRDRAVQETLLGRLAQPANIAHAVLFLASPLAAHITGQVLIVDGGQLV